MSRNKTTGRYNTRAELDKAVLFYYHQTEQNLTQVAKTTGVSVQTVNNILESFYANGEPKDKANPEPVLAADKEKGITLDRKTVDYLLERLRLLDEDMDCFLDDPRTVLRHNIDASKSNIEAIKEALSQE